MTTGTTGYATPRWGDGANIQWYGERGIVNALVSHIASASNVVACARKLLKSIEWGDGLSRSWIDRINDARFLVEISLADFGNPDLVIACRVSDEEFPYLVFIEAKVKPYPLSAGSNSDAKKAKMLSGYNSTINGQLSLKFRFASALSNTQADKNIAEIAEPADLLTQYQNQLSDSAKKPRHLCKGKLLEMIQALGLIGIPEDHCYYVAFTWDDKSDRVFNAEEDKRPLFLSATGHNLFDAIKPRYGWLGYEKLQTALGLESNVEYQGACYGMIPYLVPQAKDYLEQQVLTDLPSDTQSFINQIADIIMQACTGRRPTLAHEKGSISIRIDGFTEVKIIPREVIFVGIRESSLDDLDRQQLLEDRRIGAVTFWGVEFPLSGTDLTTDPNIKVLEGVIDKAYNRTKFT